MTQKKFIAGLYCRLSKEDELEGDSLSIENQGKILTNYAKEKGFKVYKTYIDDDKTGTDFERKGWLSLYADIKAEKVNAVLVKDLSRFGRNYIECGLYFQELVDCIGVRFVSIAEALDTIDPHCPAIKMLPFYNVFNEWFAQTTSEKVRATFANLAKEGAFLGNKPPYGYKKDAENKHKLVIDNEKAEVVQKIFMMRASGLGEFRIAKLLNAEKIPSPMNKMWSDSSVKRIIDSEAYIGSITNHKNQVVSYKNHRTVKVPKNEQITVPLMHEAIIPQELWKSVQDVLKSGKKIIRSQKSGVIHPFSGILKCKECEKKLQFAHNSPKYVGFRCDPSRLSDCENKTISEKDLNKFVLTDIKNIYKLVIEDEKSAFDRVFKHLTKIESARFSEIKEELRKIVIRINLLKNMIEVIMRTEFLEKFQLKYVPHS